MNNINFTGTFLINYGNNKNTKALKEEFETKTTRHGKIKLENYNGIKNQTLYILRNSRDYDVAEFVKLHNLKFKYMPDISSKDFIDVENDEAIINNEFKNMKSAIITESEDLAKYVKDNRVKHLSMPNSSVSVPNRIMNLLNFKFKDGYSHRHNYGGNIINDGDIECRISPKSKDGFYYVIITSNNIAPKNDMNTYFDKLYYNIEQSKKLNKKFFINRYLIDETYCKSLNFDKCSENIIQDFDNKFMETITDWIDKTTES